MQYFFYSRLQSLFVGVIIIIFSFLLVPTQLYALQFSDIAAGATTNDGIQALIQSYFPDNYAVMIAIAQCESGLREFKSDGTVLRGGDGVALGVFQINEKSHAARAVSMGLDINTSNGNIAYAKYLYDHSGTDPWVTAYSCWNKSGAANQSSTIIPTSVSTATVVVQDLSYGMTSPDILPMQKQLNKLGFTIATSGLGSRGKETATFGSLTRSAVRRFQCAKAIVCSGDEFTTGYGLVNTVTRDALFAPQPLSSSAPAIRVPPASFGIVRDLELGLTGPDVIYLQNFLIQHGLFSTSPILLFDHATQNAVIQFQKNNAIVPAFGYVGAKTKAKMKQLLGL